MSASGRTWNGLPADVDYLSIYSRSDGVVNWRACLDRSAEHQEVASSHCGMAVSPRVYGLVAAKLAELRARERRFARRLNPDRSRG